MAVFKIINNKEERKMNDFGVACGDIFNSRKSRRFSPLKNNGKCDIMNYQGDNSYPVFMSLGGDIYVLLYNRPSGDNDPLY